MTFPRIISSEDFNVMLENRRTKIKAVLSSKAGEYASDKDRLHNFKSAARFDNETPEKALWGMWKKHLVSIQDVINRIETAHQNGIVYEISDAEGKIIDEKITDTVNYAILLEGLFHARRSIYKEAKDQSPLSKS